MRGVSKDDLLKYPLEGVPELHRLLDGQGQHLCVDAGPHVIIDPPRAPVSLRNNAWWQQVEPLGLKGYGGGQIYQLTLLLDRLPFPTRRCGPPQLVQVE